MIRILPFILIPILILGGLGYWRYVSSKPKLTTPQTQTEEQPIEVPKTLPQASLDDRVKSLEDLSVKLATQINNLKSPTPQSSSASNTKNIEAQITELKARVSALEKATPAPAASTQSVVYIPLGATSGLWGTNSDWLTASEYQISLDPSSYPSYTGMNLEVVFRLIESSGVGSARLFNATDNSVVSSSQVDTSSSTYVLQSSGSFKLATGTKTYKLQVKTTGKEMYIQSARLKVNF